MLFRILPLLLFVQIAPSVALASMTIPCTEEIVEVIPGVVPGSEITLSVAESKFAVELVFKPVANAAGVAIVDFEIYSIPNTAARLTVYDSGLSLTPPHFELIDKQTGQVITRGGPTVQLEIGQGRSFRLSCDTSDPSFSFGGSSTSGGRVSP